MSQRPFSQHFPQILTAQCLKITQQVSFFLETTTTKKPVTDKWFLVWTIFDKLLGKTLFTLGQSRH